MATLEEEIRKLEQKIDDLDREYQDAGSEVRKDNLLQNITAKETRLNTLLQQRREQQQQQQQQQQLQAQAGGGQDDFTSMLGASFYIHLGDYRGNAVAITPTKALTALHGKGSVGDKVTLVGSSGANRSATVIYSEFVEMEVDIAVVVVDAGEKEFSVFIPVCAKPVHLLQEVIVIGIKPTLSDRESSTYASIGRVTFIEPSAPLFQSAYTCHDGLSGAGVIATVEGGEYHVVGVHVASHDDTAAPPPIKKKKGGVASADSVSESNQSLSDSIHGHTSYALICEVKRVRGIDADTLRM